MRWLIVVLLAASAGAAPAADQNRMHREPWEWSDEERIAERCDRSRAPGRIEAAARTGTKSTSARDVIDGKTRPHLFLAVELFEMMVKAMYVYREPREIMASKIALSGLPADFAEQLEPMIELYLAALQERHSYRAVSRSEEATRRMAALEPVLCRDRLEAYREAREAFGPALDVYLYRYFARNVARFIDGERPCADELRARAAGCR